MKEKKKFSFPHPIVTLFSVIVLLAICSYFIPAGLYDRVIDPETGRSIVDPNSFHYVAQAPASFLDIFRSVIKGMGAGQEIIFFILIVGGSFQIITSTGAIESGIGHLAIRTKKNGIMMVPILIAVFSISGATFGISEENMVLIPIGIALARALGYDAIVGMTMITLGSMCGFAAGPMNPFTVGVAQDLAELPMYSGMWYRVICWIIMVIIASIYISRYALKIKNNPEKSYVRELEVQEADQFIDIETVQPLTKRQKVVLMFVCAMVMVLLFGIFRFKWGIIDIGAVFMVCGIACGLVAGYGPNELVKEFIGGIKTVVGGAIMVGIARGILEIMQQGMIVDTFIHGMTGLLQQLPKTISIIGMYIVQIIINFFVPSGSGQAAATMPIMIPIADVLDINRQVAVLAYQFGDGFTTSIIPTSGSLMAFLSIAKIPYDRYVKFLAPLMLLWLVAGGIAIVIAEAINLGPF